MNKRIKITLVIFVLLIFFIIILHTNFVLAGSITNEKGTYTYSETDDGTDGPDVENLRFHITIYGDPGEGTLNGSTLEDFKHVNEEHGWNEIEIDGEYYAVLAGATHYLLKPERKNGARIL